MASFGKVALGVGYQVGGAFDFAVLDKDGKSQKGYNNTFFVRPAFAVAYFFNQAMSLEARLGVGYNFIGTENKGDKSVATAHTIEMFGSVGVNYALTQAWGIKAGVQVGGNVWSSVSAKSNGYELKDAVNGMMAQKQNPLAGTVTGVNVAYNHIYLTPYVGFSYAY